MQSAVLEYKERHGTDPSELLIQDHVSDEASGPEDDEPIKEWKTRMACLEFGETYAHQIGDEKLDGMRFLEVIEPRWRSNEVS